MVLDTMFAVDTSGPETLCTSEGKLPTVLTERAVRDIS